MKVIKFGGSSISTPNQTLNVLDIIQSYIKAGNLAAVIVSAFGNTTDQLISMSTLSAKKDNRYRDNLSDLKTYHQHYVGELLSNERKDQTLSMVNDLFLELEELLNGIYLLKELSPRTLDLILSYGERLSAKIMSESLKSKGMDVDYLDAREVIKTDRVFGDARVDMTLTEKTIKNYFKKQNAVPIVTGFIASSHEGESTTLGRSGSDYTAAILGAALQVNEIEIWTDVDGVMTSDPRKVPDATLIESMSYEEAMEMSHFGAEVIFPPAMQPAMVNRIQLKIRNTFHTSCSGTIIGDEGAERKEMITGLTSIEEIALLRIQGSGLIGITGISGRLFQVLTKQEINIILITQASSEHSICFAVEQDKAVNAKNAIEKEFELEIKTQMIDKMKVESGLSILAVVGENMRHIPGIAGKVFSALGSHGINVIAIAQGSSERNISIVIDNKDEIQALNVLHNTFFNSEQKTINLFIVGTGLVGGELLRLINRFHHATISIKVKGLINSRKMVFDQKGIPLESLKKYLKEHGHSTNIEDLIQNMVKLKDVNNIFVDCTANEGISKLYTEILSNQISIVTANKIANTQSWDKYRKLREAANQNRVKFLYSTNVGAGLPFISTLRDLINSGDEVLKIEAVMSGSLNYIFNAFDGKKSFSEAVSDARDLGYTEPDPRIDLSGIDVTRKMLILAREMNMQLELDDFEVESLLPQRFNKQSTVEKFMVELSAGSFGKSLDIKMEKRRNQADKNGNVLRYIATFEHGIGKVKLAEIGRNHPFYLLQENENIIAFTTRRYYKSPLIVRGPGAGAVVTSAGVLADILKVVV